MYGVGLFDATIYGKFRKSGSIQSLYAFKSASFYCRQNNKFFMPKKTLISSNKRTIGVIFKCLNKNDNEYKSNKIYESDIKKFSIKTNIDITKH
ncbi:MAG: hypothetical protein HRT42_09015 [Campylobacteraceae bacterium]|nr:hypothetical protein [Campylobacteraceae bacterium]